jgi:hypothetical protein
MASLMCGSGLGCWNAPGEDLHLDCSEVTIRDGMSGKDRVTTLPVMLKHLLVEHPHASRRNTTQISWLAAAPWRPLARCARSIPIAA